MKIIAMRHGEKDPEGNLTPHGRQVSKQLGSSIPRLHNPVAVSSTTPRVRDTVSEFLTGNGNPSISVRPRKYISIDGFSPEFNSRWDEELKINSQEVVMQDFLNGEWLEITPQKEAQKLILKLIYILGHFDKRNGENLSDVVSGSHSLFIESVLISLFGDDAPDNWKTPINFSEHALLEVQKGKKGNPILVVRYRDTQKKITLARMREVYQTLYGQR